MPCQPIKFDGGYAIVCARGRRRKRCSVCRQRPETKLCDHPTGPGKTCDAALCNVCAVNVGPDRDMCPQHAKPKEPDEAVAGW